MHRRFLRTGCSSTVAAITTAVIIVAGGCGSSSPPRSAPTTTAAELGRGIGASSTTALTTPLRTAPTSRTTAPTTAPATAPTTVPTASAGLPETADGGPGRFAPTGSGVLDRQVVAIDPGHNGRNYTAPSVINADIWNGRESETCDTTGTETDGGYTEAEFNWNVAVDLTADLRAEGATVVLTRTSNTGVGPCVTERAAIGNEAHADAAVSIHADGGPTGGRGVAVLEPVADGPNSGVITSSAELAQDMIRAFVGGTGEPTSSYDGVNGLQPRDDLGGLNLTTVPKVLIECANMRNPEDASLLVSPAWQAAAARAMASGITTFLTRRS